MSTSHRTRLGAVHAQRAALCERLAAAGAQQPVAAATAAASADEVAASLEVNLRTEGFMFAAHNLSMVALGMPVLFARVRRGRRGVRSALAGAGRRRGLRARGLTLRRAPSPSCCFSRRRRPLRTPIHVGRPTF
jgi:hypothetical protein